MEDKEIKKLYSDVLGGLSYNEFKKMIQNIYNEGYSEGSYDQSKIDNYSS